MKTLSIAIDGPAGAGKSTIAKETAKRLKYVYVDTGAMYRALGIYIKKKGINPDHKDNVSAACQDVNVTISYEDGEQQVYLDNENITHLIRTEEAGNIAYKISAYPAIRKMLVRMQQSLADKENVVMDGRDIGTKVLIEAKLKIYLTAASKVRAQRRYLELTEKGIECDVKKIEENIIERDYQDINRKESPLMKADDAVYIDSSDMSIEEVIEQILDLYASK